ncbi:MAG: hypothetical protein PHV17_08975 [Candidatus Omnitrophica bacterium]|nr:hypothetical protein [Candidatus Omnitrophota bacterium]
MTLKTSRLKKQKRLFEVMVVARIKLNPEQAVLSCCDSALKVEVASPLQCHALVCTGATNLNTSS